MSAAVLLGAVAAALYAPAHGQTISPRRLLEVVDFAPPVVSPDGGRVAFRVEQASIERNTYDTVWYVQNMDGGEPPRRVADGGAPLRDPAGVSLSAAAVWSPDGRWIYYRALMDGKVDIWRAAADGAGAEPLTGDAADVRDFSLSVDGQTLMYSVGATREEITEAEQDEYDRGVRIEETVPIGQPLFRSGDMGGSLVTQRFRGPWFGRTSLLANVPERWKAVRLATRERFDLDPSGFPPRPLTASDLATGLPEPWILEPHPDGDRIALLTRIGNGEGLLEKPEVELTILPSKMANVLVKCVAELCREKAITSVQWRPNSDEVLFTVSDPLEGLAQSIFRWNVRTGSVQPVVHARGLVNGGRVRSSVCGVSTEALACVAADPDRPPRLERIDLDTGHRQVLFAPNAALALDMEGLAPAQLLRWTDAYGQSFTGQFFPGRRTGDGRLPLFVTYYSCTGFLRGGVGDEWPLSTLAENGISALCINAPPNFPIDAVERYGQGLSAVKSAVELLAETAQVDCTKVGMGGLSFGSEVTLWTVMNSDLLAAASVTSNSVTPNYYLFYSLRDAFLEGLKRVWGLRAPAETPERWKELSPTFNLDSIQAPVLFQMPEQEYIVALDYALPLMRTYRADLYVFPNEPHQKLQPRHKLAAYNRNVDWFRFWLQGYQDPDQSKIQQYSAWHSMLSATN